MLEKDPKQHVLIVPFNEFNRLAACAETCLNIIKRGERAKVIYFKNKYHSNRFLGLGAKLGKSSAYPMIHLFEFLKSRGVEIEEKSELDSNSIEQIESFEESKFSNAKEIKGLNYKGYNIGLGIFSSLMSASNCSEPDLSKYDSLIKRFLFETALTIEYCLNLRKEISNQIVHVFNGRFHHCRAIVEVIKEANISIEYYEIVAYNGYRLINQPEPIHNFSYRRKLVKEMWEAGPANKSELGAVFFDNDYRLKDKSSRTYHDNQIQNLIPEKKKKVRWVYYSSSDDEYESLSDVFIHPIFDSQKQGVLWLIDQVAKRGDVELIIRVHPHKAKKCKGDSDWWCKLEGENMILIDPFSKTDTYALARSADIVLCYNSTIGLESTYMGKPVIMLGDSFYRGMKCGYEPNSIQELDDLLNYTSLEPFPKENCLTYGYYMHARGTSFRYYKPTALAKGSFDVFYHGFWKSIWHERLGTRIMNVYNKLINVKSSFSQSTRML